MTYPYAPAPEAPVPTPPRRPGWLVPLVAALVVLVLAAGGVAAWALTRPSSPATTVALTSAAPAKPTHRWATTLDEDGWYAVAPGPKDNRNVTLIEPGIYQTDGPADGSCIIDGQGGPASLSRFVRAADTVVLTGDAIFYTKGCLPWRLNE